MNVVTYYSMWLLSIECLYNFLYDFIYCYLCALWKDHITLRSISIILKIPISKYCIFNCIQEPLVLEDPCMQKSELWVGI